MEYADRQFYLVIAILQAFLSLGAFMIHTLPAAVLTLMTSLWGLWEFEGINVTNAYVDALAAFSFHVLVFMLAF